MPHPEDPPKDGPKVTVIGDDEKKEEKEKDVKE